jgi:hypothetical protein
MAIYKVTAGAVPMVHDRKVNTKPGEVVKPNHVVKFDEPGARYVGNGDLIDESFFKTGEVLELVKEQFIEEYIPAEEEPATKGGKKN